MTVKENLTDIYSKLIDAKFIGYNTAKGSRMYGTLSKVSEGNCIETPVAENLMVGIAVGMALQRKFLPVVCFERHEFALYAMGQLGVMADKLPYVGGKQFTLPMIVRCIKGGTKPLYPGLQHCGDYADAISDVMNHSICLDGGVNLTYDGIAHALNFSASGIVVILEDRDGYEQTVGS